MTITVDLGRKATKQINIYHGLSVSWNWTTIVQLIYVTRDGKGGLMHHILCIYHKQALFINAICSYGP